MKRIYTITVLSALTAILVAFSIKRIWFAEEEQKHIKVGFLYVGDASASYTCNFLKAQNSVEQLYGKQVEVSAKYNIAEGNETAALQELLDEGCGLIFSTSYGFGEATKKFAQTYSDVQFCQATCANANEEPLLDNYHTFMGEIYQGRYISGVAAGMKLQELIEAGKITPEQAKIGYVGAYPYAEVISGYTAFFLGVRSVVPQASMTVIYTNTWSGYAAEKEAAKELIEEGCIIISQHSDTTGPAVACEDTDKSVIVYHVGYNQSMANVAPTTHLTGTRINWEPYITAAVGAILSDKTIEDCLAANIHGNDAGAGFEKGWVEMLEINEIAAAKGTQQKIEELIEQFKQKKIQVFKGEYIGINPYDDTDTYDLSKGYTENETSSAPTFHYVLKDVITIKE